MSVSSQESSHPQRTAARCLLQRHLARPRACSRWTPWKSSGYRHLRTPRNTDATRAGSSRSLPVRGPTYGTALLSITFGMTCSTPTTGLATTLADRKRHYDRTILVELWEGPLEFRVSTTERTKRSSSFLTRACVCLSLKGRR